MNTITVSVTQLQEALRSNAGKHRESYEAAVERYRAKAVEVFEQNIEEVKKNGEVQQWLNLPVPQDHTKDYERALEMLKWHQDDKIELTMSEFQTYVQDDWNWKLDFTSTNATYGVTS